MIDLHTIPRFFAWQDFRRSLLELCTIMRRYSTLLIIGCIVVCNSILAQPSVDPTSKNYRIVTAGSQYAKSERFQKKWGTHYRKEWATPVRVYDVSLDTLAGGVTPYQAGGGRQTMTLRLRDANGREYVLRSIDKRFGKALPEIYQGTFIEKIINDQVSIAHPYSAVTISPLAEAAGILHTKPQIVFVPKQESLGKYNEEFGDILYLFEQRPDEDWSVASNLGNSKNIIGTEKLLENLRKDNEVDVDEKLFIRSRLFDFVIGDWGRHEDQWRWATVEVDGKKIYRPIPRDRDQAYTLFDGKRLQRMLSAANLDHLQSFDTTIMNVNTFTFPARNLDRRIATESTEQDWISIAKDIQNRLTDQVIEQAVLQLPPEVYPISGPTIAEKLKSRRDHLAEYASGYYKFLAEEVNVLGSDKNEVFIVHRGTDGTTLVEIHKLKLGSGTDKEMIYSRAFAATETDEIRLYGLGGDDVFHISGDGDKGITVRVIGGEGNDVVVDSSSVKGSRKMTLVYDNERSHVYANGETKVRISNDTLKNKYRHEVFDYDDKGFFVKPSASSISIGYGTKSEKWGHDPVGSDHDIRLKYRVTRQALNLEYNGIFYQALGRWNATLTAGASFPDVVNFFGIGNESPYNPDVRSYYNRLRSQDFYAKAGVNRISGNHRFDLQGFYHTIKIYEDRKRVIHQYMPIPGTSPLITGQSVNLDRRHFVGTEARYLFKNWNHPVVPRSGFNFGVNGSYTHNLTNTDKSFTRVAGDMSAYLPIFKFLTFATRIGGAQNLGTSEFYQLNQLGSHDNLRGFRKYRFYGKQMAYTNNELRFMFDHKSKLFNGKVGILGFYDVGRVWQPGESSNKWHAGYGGGIFISPFNKIIFTANYGRSDEDGVFTFHTGFFF